MMLFIPVAGTCNLGLPQISALDSNSDTSQILQEIPCIVPTQCK